MVQLCSVTPGRFFFCVEMEPTDSSNILKYYTQFSSLKPAIAKSSGESQLGTHATVQVGASLNILDTIAGFTKERKRLEGTEHSVGD